MYELVFWNYQEEVYLNHHLVYEAIEAKEMVEGLENLPVDVILNRIANVFLTGKKWMLQVIKIRMVPELFILPPRHKASKLIVMVPKVKAWIC